MSSNRNSLRSRIAMIATAGITGALLVGSPLAASAAPTVVDYASTNAADYPTLMHSGGNGGTDWAPWANGTADAVLNASWITGSANWNGRPGWAAHNFAVQDDGSGTNNALWVQKGKAGCKSSGVQVAKVANGSSLISSANKVITVKVKANDANVPVEATLTDAFGGNVLKVTATAATANAYNTLSFNFANATTGSYISNFSYTTLSLVFDPANAIAGNSHDDWGQGPASASVSKAYIMDDLTYTVITGADTPPGPDVPHLLTFEDADSIGSLAAGDASDAKWAGSFEGGGSGIATPAVKRTGKALEFNKVGGDAWTGLNFVQAPSGEVITSGLYKNISFDYYSPVATMTPVSIKLLVNDADYVKAAFKAKKGWQTFTIDMSTITGAGGTWSADKNYTKLVIYPDWADADILPAGVSNPTTPITSTKFYIDNVSFNGWALPTKTGTPTRTGTAKVGQVQTAGGITFGGNRITRSFKWYRCTVQGKTVKFTAPVAADKCTVIAGATGSTYTLVAADKGKYVRVALTATTPAGSVTALTTSTSKVG
ncbi:MAG: Stenotrophomonas phage Moby [Actinomycetota bacterium]